MKFLSNVDLVLGWGIFTRSVVLWTWLAIAVILGVYLGRAHATRVRAAARAASVCFGSSRPLPDRLPSGSARMSGRRLGELEAFLPPADQRRCRRAASCRGSSTIYDAALARPRARTARILVDFTGYTCTNCRWMEANMFTGPDVMREMAEYVRASALHRRPGRALQAFPADGTDDVGDGRTAVLRGARARWAAGGRLRRIDAQCGGIRGILARRPPLGTRSFTRGSVMVLTLFIALVLALASQTPAAPVSQAPAPTSTTPGACRKRSPTTSRRSVPKLRRCRRRAPTPPRYKPSISNGWPCHVRFLPIRRRCRRPARRSSRWPAPPTRISRISRCSTSTRPSVKPAAAEKHRCDEFQAKER